MSEKFPQAAREVMDERFGHDTLLALATTDENTPWVRTVNSYYEDGAFYVITHALSRKMQQIEKNPSVAICGDWFTAHGIGENLGHILAPGNAALADRLRSAFASWYGNGHIDEADSNTCILRIRLTDGVLHDHGRVYHIDFT
ncbi:MAG: pyridoxamine 5'-phosphate oxidase family protein [Clostridia bacterium]|nr:pyridoxamine 5'-phosphate oxidase family protein [Clostridia bacterium]